MPKALVYCRVSTQEQAREGYSLEAQERQVRLFCAAAGWEVAGCYVEEGASGATLERPALRRLLDDLPQFSDPCIVVWRLDRLTRSVADLYRLLERLEAAHCTFRSVTEPFETQSAVGRLFVTLIAAIAQWERENLAERVALGQEHKVEHTDTWTGGPAPYGYRLEAGRLVPDPDTAPVVRRIYDVFRTSPNVHALMRTLNREGVRPPGHGRSGWTARGLGYILRNPAYAGIRTYRRHARGTDGGAYRLLPEEKWQITEGHAYPALVSLDTWHAVQGFLGRGAPAQGRRAPGPFPLTGLLRCGRCQAPLSGKTASRAADRSLRYYRCPGHYQRQECNLAQVGSEPLEAAVLEAVDRRWPASVLLVSALAECRVARSETAETWALCQRLRELARRRRRWEDAYECEEIDVLTLSRRLARLDGEVRDTRLALLHPGASCTPPVGPFPVPTLAEAWGRLGPAERSVFLREVLSRVVVFPDGTVDLSWRVDG